MSNCGIAAPAAPSRGSVPGPFPAVYHAPMQTGYLDGGHFFSFRAVPGPSPMPESHSP
jgi:hypothetical protein